MQLAFLLAQQVTVMFLLLLVGVALTRFGKMDADGLRYVSNILLYAVTPCLLIDAFQTPFSEEKYRGVLLAVGLSVLSHAVSIALNRWALLRGDGPPAVVERFSAVYTNAGYMGVPLVQAVFGDEQVLYACA
jgi:predicted permease